MMIDLVFSGMLALSAVASAMLAAMAYSKKPQRVMSDHATRQSEKR